MSLLLVNEVANTARAIIDGLSARGFDVSFFQPVTNANTKARWRLMLGRLSLPISLALRARGHELVYFNYATLAYFAMFVRRPLVVHCHGTDLRENLQNGYRAMTLRALKQARFLLYSTPDLLDYIPEALRAKSHFLPNPVDVQRFSPQPKLTGQGLKIFFISKLDRTKGVEHFLRVAEALASDERVAQLTLFSHGNAVPHSLPKHDKIHYLGRIDYDEMCATMREHDIAVGQMQLGAIGMSELEAMACGMPVVANFKYGHRYETPPPILHAESSEAALIQIKRILDEPAMLTRFSSESRDWVAANHSKDAVCELLIALLGQYLVKEGNSKNA